MPNNSFHVDSLSFWLGFIIATLAWWLVRRIRPLLPVWWRALRRQIELISARNFSGTDDYLRRQTLLKAQSQHLASSLFALDEIIIPPSFLAPPAGQSPDEEKGASSIASAVIPYLPDWPELVAAFAVPRVTLESALKSKRHIAVIGQPGSGKTVALAHLASQLSRRDPSLADYGDALTFFFHILDLNTALQENQDPIQPFIQCACASASLVMQPQITRYLKSAFRNKQRQVILLLDGLDELPGDQLAAAVAYLNALTQALPQIQIIAASSPDYADGMLKSGFYPLALSAWNDRDRKAFARRWGDLWFEHVAPKAGRETRPHPVDAKLMENWLEDEKALSNPLEWTLRLWGAYAGDLSGTYGPDNLRAYITRFLPDPAVLPAIQQVAYDCVLQQRTSMGFDEMERLLSSQRITPSTPNHASTPESAGEDQSSLPLPEKPSSGARKKRVATPGEQIIDALIDGGVLVQHHGDRLSFSNPALLGFLAGGQISPEDAGQMAESITNPSNRWPAALQALRYAAACTEEDGWIMSLSSEVDPPLFAHLLIPARWLADAPAKAPWRNEVMRRLVSSLSDENLPLGIRARCIAALHLSGDGSIDRLYRQLLVSKSPTIRRIGLLGCGASGNPQLIDSLLTLLADQQPEVRYTACLALAALPGSAASNVVAEILNSGDEEIRQAAAEALSQNPDEGYAILRDAITQNDLLTRRAAVFGLLQIHEEWAQKALEKVAVEDAQWVVRNAAAQALTELHQPLPAIPGQLPAPWNAGWLIAFAGKLGLGIQPDQPATELLFTVLKTGAIEEQIGALSYLRDQPEEEVIREIYQLLERPEADLREAVIYTLWWMALSGVALPAPELSYFFGTL